MIRDGKVLIVGPAWVGDMVIAQALFRILRRDGARQIDVIAPGWSRAVLSRMPEIDTAHVLDIPHGELGLRKRYTLGQRLRDDAYDHAIILPRSYKSALVPWFANIPERVGFRSEFRYGVLTETRVLDRQRLDQTVKRFASLGLPTAASLAELPEPKLDVSPENQRRLIDKLQLSTQGGVIALMPGAAYGPAKMWPIAYFSKLARMLTERGHPVWVLGTASERALGETIAAAAGPATRNLCGQTQLDDTVDLLALATAAVSNDSGLMHIAAAAGTHVIGLYGSTPPHFAPPLTGSKTIHFLGLECSPCRQRKCPLGHLNCLRQIEPTAVLSSISSVTQP